MNRVLSFISAKRNYIIAISAILILAFVLLVRGLFAPVGNDKTPVVVIVKRGATAGAIGDILAEKGLVRSSFAFSFIARFSGESSKIKPGAYRFDQTMSGRVMLDKMVKGEVAAVWVTVPEGFTLRQIADRLAAKGLVDRDVFIQLAESGASDFSSVVNVPAQGLEGYLFPNTYLIMLDSNPKDIVSEMLESFNEQVEKPLDADLAHTGQLSKPDALYRAITVASMIEREAKVAKDRPLVSAVIWNRLDRGMRLEVDATVQYALGEHHDRLYYRDLRVNSPYNTYLNPGLPPGPISNPGLESIKAALHPAKVDYLYYVARPDGSHIFSRTLEEHNAAIRRIRSRN